MLDYNSNISAYRIEEGKSFQFEIINFNQEISLNCLCFKDVIIRNKNPTILFKRNFISN